MYFLTVLFLEVIKKNNNMEKEMHTIYFPHMTSDMRKGIF